MLYGFTHMLEQGMGEGNVHRIVFQGKLIAGTFREPHIAQPELSSPGARPGQLFAVLIDAQDRPRRHSCWPTPR